MIADPNKKRALAVKVFKFQGHRDCIYQLESAGDDKSFFSAGGDGMIVRWNLDHPDQGNLIARTEGSVYSMCFIPSTGILLAGQNNEGIHAIDVIKKERVASSALGSVSIFDLKVSGGRVYAGTSAGELVILDPAELKTIAKLKLSEGSLRTIAIHPLTGNLALGFSDCSVKIFDTRSGTVTEDWQAHHLSVFTLCWSPDGKYLLSGSRDAKIKCWEWNDQGPECREVTAHLFAVNHVIYSPGGEHFLTCSMDKTIKIWSSRDLSLHRVLDKARHAGHGHSVNRLVWINDDTFASAGDDRIISVWKLQKEQP
ncbi:MAG: WD40 repeat domain-containing protein [Cyclobacteriaceae bacterium]